MKYFDAFKHELCHLDIDNIPPFITLAYYNKKPNYMNDAQLKRLLPLSVTELLSIPIENTKLHLKQLNFLKKEMIGFKEKVSRAQKKAINNTLDQEKFLAMTEEFFNIEYHIIPRCFDNTFFTDFLIILSSREKALTKLIQQLEAIVEHKQEKPKIIPVDFRDCFIDYEQYKKIAKILVDRKLCEKETLIWKDAKKGSYKYLISLLKHLYVKGYYKKEIKITNLDYKMIALNSFRLEIGIATCKMAHADSFDFSFIPVCNS